MTDRTGEVSALENRENPEQSLALMYVPVTKRAAVEVLWALDLRLGANLYAAREPALQLLRLAWWRDEIAQLHHASKPNDPQIDSVRRLLLPSIAIEDLSQLVSGWEVVVDLAAEGVEALDRYAEERGETLFRLTAQLLGHEPASFVLEAGKHWALVDLAYRSHDTELASMAIERADALKMSGRWPTPLRPLGMLAALARRDAKIGLIAPRRLGSPGRIARMIFHRITGR